ncbi:MAG TPA: hypothetical protein VFV65_03375 [Gemmatimonadales bacterium]|nr:hypothetical protein [Gemmatimonadales bacterium]
MRIAPLLAIALGAAACAKEPAPDVAAAPQELVVTATDYAYELPATPVVAGPTRITLVNKGQELHHITLMRLTEGKTMADLAGLDPEGPPPTWAIPAGGPNAAVPGGESTATLLLEPGSYVITCFIPSPDGVPHIAKGMSIGLEVQPATGPAGPMPTGDITIGLTDYAFTMSAAPTAGTHSFVVTNQAQQPHEVVLVRMEPGTSMESWNAWLEAGMTGPPPGMPFAGLSAMAPGMVQDFTAELTPGTYGFICFVPDAGDGKPHSMHGMVVSFDVS